jgi:hypothetical protein
MLRGKTILTTAALLGVCAVPASAQEYQDLRSPDAKDAAREAQGMVTGPSQDLRPPDVKDAAEGRGPYANDEGPYVLNREYGSPDAVDAALDLPPATATAGPGIFTDEERKLVESPEVQGMVDRVSSEIRATPAVIEVQAPSGGFDWGDAGIGAAGMLALFSIGAGSALLISGRRRRPAPRVATH